MRSSKLTPAASNSSFCQPKPTPSSNLPLDIASKVATVLASNAGFLSGAIKIAVANLILDVFEAIIVNNDSGSCHGASDGRGNFPKGYF